MKIKYELLFFYLMGFKPKEIIKLGYKPATVYKFKRIYFYALQKFKEKLKF